MCLNPIIMRNPVKHTLGGLEYIQVPCRHCQECADIASTDYVVRSIALINSLPDYSVFFCTLTFNEIDVPRTTVYKFIDGKWQPYEHNVRCFNHELYRRFRKNFNEYWFDLTGKKAYLLTTCEFGEHNTRRPHYHCICLVPSPNLSWRSFKSVIERFWHYGFTKDIAITQQDGLFHRKSLLNCVKYVTKYISKFNTKLPYYLTSSEYCTDYPPYEIKPRVFVSQGYGASLSSILTHSNYVNNSVVLDFDGKKRNYSIPSYYIRKYFTYTESKVIRGFYPELQGFPYDSKLQKRKKYKRESTTFRRNGYDTVMFNNFKTRLKSLIFHYNQDIQGDERLRDLLPTINYGDYEETEDWCLSPTLYDDMCSYYLQAWRPSPLSPLPLSPQREAVVKRVAISPDNKVEENLNFCVSNHLPFNRCEYVTSLYIRAKAKQREYCLPWLDMPCISFASSRPTDYTLPPDYGKLQFYQHYKRNVRKHQALIKAENDYEWLKSHYIPYQ